MPKKTKSFSKTNNDFFFLVVVSVFAVLTIFAASYINSSTKAVHAGQNVKSLDVAPLYVK